MIKSFFPRCLLAIFFLALATSCSQKQSEHAATQTTVPQNTVQSEHTLTWQPPEGWQKEQPQSTMRKAQYRLARVDGDPEDATVAIFYFPGQGGSVQANIQRWYGQFKQPDGKSTADIAKVTKTTANGLQQSLIEITGTYLFKPMMMAPKATEKPNFKMLGGIVETPGGPWFVKLVGPKKTIDKWQDSFYDFMKTFKE